MVRRFESITSKGFKLVTAAALAVMLIPSVAFAQDEGAESESSETQVEASDTSTETQAMVQQEVSEPVENYVAYIDTTDNDGVTVSQGYDSLASALEAAGTTDTSVSVRLAKNTTENVTVNSGQNITLDLNGYTLSGGTTSGVAALTNKGSLVIKDSSSAGTGTIKREDVGAPSYYTLVNDGGTLTFLSGLVTNDAGFVDKWSGSSLVCNGRTAASTMYVNGGSFTQGNFITLKNDAYGTMYITNGVITSNVQSVQNWGTLEISGGTMSSDVATWAYNTLAGNTIISGGSIGGKTSVHCYDGITAIPSLTITGGTVKGWVTECLYRDGVNYIVPVGHQLSKAIIKVMGGTFTSGLTYNYADQLMPTGYEAVSSEDGLTYTVGITSLKTESAAVDVPSEWMNEQIADVASNKTSESETATFVLDVSNSSENVSSSDAVSVNKVTVPTNAIDSLVENNVDLVVRTDDVTATLDQDILKQLQQAAEEAGADVSSVQLILQVSDDMDEEGTVLKDTQLTALQEQAGVQTSDMVLVLSAKLLVSDDPQASSVSFGEGNTVKVAIALEPPEQGKKYVLSYVSDDGLTVEQVEAQYDETTQALVANLSHFSDYVVTLADDEVAGSEEEPSNGGKQESVDGDATQLASASVSATQQGSSSAALPATGDSNAKVLAAVVLVAVLALGALGLALALRKKQLKE